MGAAALEAGRVVGSCYELEETIGKGSTGWVWRARHQVLGHRVAIKFLNDHALSADVRARFLREAKVAAKLSECPHVAAVLDAGVDDAGRPYLVMEHLRGESLDARLARERRLPFDLVVRIVTQLCTALQAAHDVGILHRDVKPGNVFLVGENDVKLLDFGIAKARLDDSFQTIEGTMIGTPNFMSPERLVEGSTIDARADLCAVAVTAYRMATGEMPFGRPALGELVRRIRNAEARAPSSIIPGLPTAFDEWMARGLEKDPNRRFSDARVMAAALTLPATSAPRRRAPTFLVVPAVVIGLGLAIALWAATRSAPAPISAAPVPNASAIASATTAVPVATSALGASAVAPADSHPLPHVPPRPSATIPDKAAQAWKRTDEM